MEEKKQFKKSKLTQRISKALGTKSLLTLLTVFTFHYGISCSVFKITKNGKTIVGNNEDYFNPSTKIWFEPKSDTHKYGVAYVGFDNDFGQGALNTEGLVFDGFAMQYLAVNDTAGKLNIHFTEYLPYIMRNFSKVREVKEYFKTINLHHLTNSMFLFVDKSGEYLIVEGDSLIIGNDPVFTLSNFYPSQTKSQDEVDISFYQKGKKYIENNTLNADFKSCSNVMKNLQQETTQYSSIYDLSAGIIKIYHFHNYEASVDFKLNEELEKGHHSFIIPELFSKESAGYKFYFMYNNDPEAMLKLIGGKWETAKSMYNGETQKLIAKEIEQTINTIGYEWLRKGKLDGAIKFFTYNTILFPKAPNTYDSLGEAYLTSKQYDLSIENYKKAIRLNRKNKAPKAMLKKVRLLKKASI